MEKNIIQEIIYIKIIKIDNMLKYIEYEKIINQMELKIGIMKNT